jgi:hypothetical protein
VNQNCAYIKRGDHADCFRAGGGRGAKDDWCPSCLLLRTERAERVIGTLASWLVQAQTGFGVQDARGIERLLGTPPE